MKFAKKPLIMLVVLILAFSFGLSGCKKPTTPIDPPPPDPPAPVVASIEFTNSVFTIAAGDTVVGAKCLPEGVEQGFTATMDKPVYGVSFADKTIKVNAGAKSGDKVSITITSTTDTTKKATKEFTLNIAEPTYIDVTGYNELRNVCSTAENAAKNYRLAGNVVLQTATDDDVIDRDWVPFSVPFTGLFDGAGYTISGINVPIGTNYINSGFFKENRGVIRNVGFDNSEYSDKWMNMGPDSGVVVGKNLGAISNVWTNVPLATANGAAAALVGINEGFIENSYALGPVVSNSETDKAGVIGSNTGSVTGVVADKALTGINNFYGAVAQQGDTAANEKLLSSVMMQTKATYTAMAWSENAWHIDNVYPILKNEDFDAEDIVKRLEIIGDGVIEVGDLTADKTFALNLKRTNAAHDEIEWKVSALSGQLPSEISIDATKGILKINVPVPTAGTIGALDGTMIMVQAKIKDGGANTAATFTICNDGYNSATGIVVDTYAKMYDVFFKTAGETDESHNRNISRNIKLGADIVMPALESAENKGAANYNWPGVADFSGVFDGQGYSITGLAVKAGVGYSIVVPGDMTYDNNASFGFFRRLGAINYGEDKGKGKGSGTIKNIALTDGYIEFVGNILNGGRRETGALVQMFGNGLIENVLVDITITTNTNKAGMIVGTTGGTKIVKKARVEGDVRIYNSLAMGKITSTLPANDPLRRKDVDPYSCGALIGYTEQNGLELVNCYARGEKTDDLNLTTRIDGSSDGGLLMNSARIEKTAFKTRDEFIMASTFNTLGFDSSIWAFKNGSYPMLKYPGWIEEDQKPVPASVEILNAVEAAYDYLDFGEIALEYEVINSIDKNVKFSATVANGSATDVAVSAEGVVTLKETISDGAVVTITATLGDTSIKDSITFTVYNDGYSKAVGVRIDSEDKLHKALISGDDKTVSRNMKRKLVLMNDITLSAHANWEGVSKEFSGNFNGQGYSIKGLNINTSSGNVGFFKKTKAVKAGDVVIENLGLEGNIVKTGNSSSNNDEFVAALVAVHNGGVIKNVRVDVNLKADDCDLTGKIVGYMKGTSIVPAELHTSVAMGSISAKPNSSLNPSNPNNWQHYAAGALIGKTEGTPNIVKESFAVIVPGDKQVGLTVRNPAIWGEGIFTNSKYISIEEFVSADTYDTEAYDKDIWYIIDGCRPALKNANSVPPTTEPSDIVITTPEATYDYLDMEKTIAVESVITNAPETYTVEYKLKDNNNDKITINATTGLITIGELVQNNIDVIIKAYAELKVDGMVIATSQPATFTILTDGYSQAGGLKITDEVSLYNALIGDGSAASKIIVDRNLKRTLNLTQDITLNTYANWPGVKGTFTGSLNGNGYAIRGFNVVVKDLSGETKQNAGYGFFKEVNGAADKEVVKNLAMYGTVKNTSWDWDSDDARVGAVAQKFLGGIMKNLLIDMDIKTNTRESGKIAGLVNGGSLTNCIAMGSMAGTVKKGETVNGEVGKWEARGSWEYGSAGAIIGKPDSGNSKISYCFVIKAEDFDNTLLKLTIRTAPASSECKIIDSDFATDGQVAGTAKYHTTFEDAIWDFSVAGAPKLIPQTTVAP